MTLRGLALVTGHKHYAMHLPLEALTVSHICENNNIRRVYFEDRSVYAKELSSTPGIENAGCLL